MKSTASAPDHRLLHVYALALLLATFISTVHAGILFGLRDFLTLLAHWARPSLGGRPADILVLLAAISGLFVTHIAEASMWAALFWKSGHLASFSDGWYFAGVSHTALGYGDVVLQNPCRYPHSRLSADLIKAESRPTRTNRWQGHLIAVLKLAKQDLDRK
jgi:hypothetical protein